MLLLDQKVPFYLFHITLWLLQLYKYFYFYFYCIYFLEKGQKLKLFIPHDYVKTLNF